VHDPIRGGILAEFPTSAELSVHISARVLGREGVRDADDRHPLQIAGIRLTSKAAKGSAAERSSGAN
jgi:hypothetical protein